MAADALERIALRVNGRYQRTVSRLFYRRPLAFHLSKPIISFTFDDFPRSSLHVGGEILGRFGARGTYYASFGLMGTTAPTGEIFVPEDIAVLLGQGHELGCHTFDHCHSWDTDPAEFEASMERNDCALRQLRPDCSFTSFSYPITQPRPGIKQKASTRFRLCRGGGQTHNGNTADLGLLKSYFLEKTRGVTRPVAQAIDANRNANGWLIFSTHDICASPTPYGCTPWFFEDIVRCAADSGARILGVAEAMKTIEASARQ
jgi:peptidoglycan/xylan/chitin deacetylase (PgdA/CDA1 family)